MSTRPGMAFDAVTAGAPTVRLPHSVASHTALKGLMDKGSSTVRSMTTAGTRIRRSVLADCGVQCCDRSLHPRLVVGFAKYSRGVVSKPLHHAGFQSAALRVVDRTGLQRSVVDRWHELHRQVVVITDTVKLVDDRRPVEF